MIVKSSISYFSVVFKFANQTFILKHDVAGVSEPPSTSLLNCPWGPGPTYRKHQSTSLAPVL